MKLRLSHILLLFAIPIFVFSMGAKPEEKEVMNSDTVVYQVDIEKSRLDWYCDIHNGNVSLDSGYIKVSNNEIIDGRFVICMESLIDLDIDNYELMRITLENTLKSIDFFYTAKFHHSFFTYDFVEKSDKGHHVTGELELMGVAQCISFDTKLEFDDDELIATSDSIVIDRTHWGITSMSKDDAKSDKSFIVPNEIGIIVHIVAYRE